MSDFSLPVEFDLDTLRASISAERINSRLSQEDVATTLGCSRKWVSRFERGLSVPDFEKVVAYARLFGIALLMSLPDGRPDFDRTSGVKSPGRGLSEPSGKA